MRNSTFGVLTAVVIGSLVFPLGARARGTRDAPVPAASASAPAPTSARVRATAQAHPIAETPALPSSEPAPSEPALELDMAAIARHAKQAARLVGHPASELAQLIRSAASHDGEVVEWNLADLGIAAGATYGYASIVAGKITGIVIRGRTTLERAHQLRISRPLRLTMSGGDRPSFSIDAGE